VLVELDEEVEDQEVHWYWAKAWLYDRIDRRRMGSAVEVKVVEVMR